MLEIETTKGPDEEADTEDARAAQMLILLNPSAGKDRTEADQQRLKDLLADLPDATVREIDTATSIEDAAQDAVAQGYGTIVAAGGDGTISTVVDALAGSGRRLGILPLGTFNFFARSLGMPQDEEGAIAVLQAGRTQALSLGEVNGRIFINNASLGAYASVLQVREQVYDRWGRSRLAAYWSVLVSMLTLYRSLSMTVTIDGRAQKVRSPLAFVAVRPFQLEKYDLSGAEAIEDGKLALFLAPAGGRVALLWRAVRILFRKTEIGRDYRLLTGREIKITVDRKTLLLARDGERERVAGPFEFRILPDALRVLVPDAPEDKA